VWLGVAKSTAIPAQMTNLSVRFNKPNQVITCPERY